MRETSWDNRGGARPGRSRPWLRWILIGSGLAFALPLFMAATFGSLALRHRAKLWPAVRAIHARLQTDEGAKDLFAKNPALSDSYANDQDFIETVRDWRARVGDLPAQEPAEGPTYSPDSDPDGISAAIQGAGGAWMRVEVQGGTLGEPVQGEGITRLYFGEDKKALRSARKKANALKTRREWEDFRKVMLQCADDGQAASLYRQEPGLHARFPTEPAFLQSMRALRPAIAKLPVTPRDDSEFGVQTYRSPFTHIHVLVFPDADGLELRATWKNDQLSNLELRPRTHRG